MQSLSACNKRFCKCIGMVFLLLVEGQQGMETVQRQFTILFQSSSLQKTTFFLPPSLQIFRTVVFGLFKLSWRGSVKSLRYSYIAFLLQKCQSLLIISLDSVWIFPTRAKISCIQYFLDFRVFLFVFLYVYFLKEKLLDGQC